jgi:DNA-binding IclR family transcriptional regulator
MGVAPTYPVGQPNHSPRRKSMPHCAMLVRIVNGTVQAVDRAAALLKAVANASPPATVPELAQACRLNRSTAWRLLATLERQGLVERDPVTQRYSVGYAIVQIAAGDNHDSLVRRARPVLERLARTTLATVSLAVAKRFNLVYVDQVDQPRALSPDWRGRSLPLHATSGGKAFLASLPKEERDVLLTGRLTRYTPTTLADRRLLERELAADRRRGYSACLGELEESLSGVSAPVLDPRGRPLAIVNAWGPSNRFGADRVRDVGARTVRAAEEIRALIV